MTAKAPDGREVRVTISVGATEASKSDASYESVLARADDAMYDAKKGGRNRTVSK